MAKKGLFIINKSSIIYLHILVNYLRPFLKSRKKRIVEIMEYLSLYSYKIFWGKPNLNAKPFYRPYTFSAVNT